MANLRCNIRTLLQSGPRFGFGVRFALLAEQVFFPRLDLPCQPKFWAGPFLVDAVAGLSSVRGRARHTTS